MSWEVLGGLAQRGFEIGAHTRRHPRLSQIPVSQLRDELEGCAQRMHEELGQRPASFAYPYGDLDHDVVDLARRSYTWGCTTDLRLLEREEDALLLPRLDIYYLRAPGVLEQWGTPAFQRRLWLRAQARRVRRLVTTAASGGRGA
jgi:peptidoglycan/xylan/chitin deacetylase (PgdA/CDA1 family)